MAIPTGAHIVLDEIPFKLDTKAQDAYTRWSRATLPPNSEDIQGSPGANLAEHELRWDITNFAGEGQKIIDISDPFSAQLFYQSEGLDFRTSGEFQLNKSVALQRPEHTGGGSTATLQGNADFTDLTGTSTGSGTDRRLNALNDEIELASARTPGAGTIQVDFYAYHDTVQTTTVQGSAQIAYSGSATVSGTDLILNSVGTVAGTTNIGSLSNGVVYEAKFYAKAGSSAGANTFKAQVVDTTNGTSVVVSSPDVKVKTTASTLIATLQWTADSSATYQLRTTYVSKAYGADAALVDYVTYGEAVSAARTVTITVYNSTGSSVVMTQDINITATAAGSLIGSLAFASAAATDYLYRFKWSAGNNKVWLDKVVEHTQTSGSDLLWEPECLDFGQGSLVWMAGTNAAANVTTWTYNTGNEDWDNRVAFASTSGKKPLAMTHTDAYEYTLVDDNKVWQHTTSASNAYIAATTATARGLTVAQNRLFVLGEDSTNGVAVYIYAVDQTSLPTALLNTVTINAAKNTPDATLRQRMCSTPTGARFYINYAGGRAIIYEVDSSPSTPTHRILGVLDEGVKATAICHTGGKTFIAGQYTAETGETPRSGLWYIDESGYTRFDGYLRRDASSSAPVSYLVPYQGDVWALQGQYVWRRSLRTGGLFLEYELPVTTNTSARALAVIQGHQFAAVSGEGIYVAGSVGTYRQTDGHYLSSIYDFGLPGTRKTLWAIEVVTDAITSGDQVVVEYQIDQDGTWTHLGTMTAGTHHHFFPSTGVDTVLFNTLQVRVRLGSFGGTSTPNVKAIIVRALPIHDQHFLDVRLLLTAEDSSFHVAGRQLAGGDLAAHLWALKELGQVLTVEDGFAYAEQGINRMYLGRIEAIQQQNEAPGIGSALVRLRLLAEAV